MNQPLNVLIVDPSEDCALVLVNYLQAGGFQPVHRHIKEHSTLEAALEEERWDVVLCGCFLSQLSPVKTLKCVRRHDRHVPLIVVAGSIRMSEVVRLVKLGAQDIVLKDDLARLKTVVERELAEAQTRRARGDLEVSLTSAIESISEGVALFDTQDRLILCNQRYKQILEPCAPQIFTGAQFEDILRCAVLEGLLEDIGNDPEAYVQKRLARRHAPDEPFEQRLTQGRWIRSEDKRTPNGGIITVLTEITERKKLDQMKNEFISTVGHELRTPLTSIKGSLALLDSGIAGQLPDEATAMISIAHKNSNRLVRLINDILDLQKIETGFLQFNFDTLGVATLLSQAASEHKAYADAHGVAIKLQRSPPDARVLADPDRLMQVLGNLLSNAAKFSPRGETITLGARRIGGSIRFSVADRGRGIPESSQDRIFQTFAQVDSSDTRKLGGSGLGLSIAKTIVDHHGGRIGFDSAKDKGTTFYFDLPVWCPEAARISAGGGRQRPKILICDDDADTRALLAEMTRELGCDAESCARAAEASQHLRDGNFAAMTVDIALPNREGIKLINEVRRHPQTHNLPVIIASAQAQNGQPGFNTGAVQIADWLEKPVDRRRFKHSLERSILQSPGHRPRILHVEDDHDHQYIVSQLVGDLCEIESVQQYRKAREFLKGSHYDLVILDLLLPDGGGECLLPLVHANGRIAPPVLIFSVKEVPQSILDNVADALVKSRATTETLKTLIERLLPTHSSTREVVLHTPSGG